MRKDELVTEIIPLALARQSTSPGHLVPVVEDFEGAISDFIDQAMGSGATADDVSPSWAGLPLRSESTLEELSVLEEDSVPENRRRRMLLLMLLLTALIWWTGDRLPQILQTAFANVQLLTF